MRAEAQAAARKETHASTMLHVTTTRHKEVYVTLVSVYFFEMTNRREEEKSKKYTAPLEGVPC